MDGLAPHVAAAIRASNARIVITGAGGWIGMATLELLAAALGDAFARRLVCFGSSSRTLRLIDGTTIDQHPLRDIAQLASAPTIVLHCAFLTKDRAEAMDEAAYTDANRAIGQILLDALDPIGAEALFIASSGAAYRADEPAPSAMRLYGRLKREEEDRFASWADRSGKRLVIARIFNLSGAHINKHDNYALAAFICDALAGRPVAIHSAFPVIRGYVAIRELVSLVFGLLLDGTTDMTRFDSGGDPLELQQVAQIVADLLGPVPVDRPTIDLGRSNVYLGDRSTYRAHLDAHAIEPVPFSRQVIETAAFLSSLRDPPQGHRVAMAKRPC